MLQYDLGKGAKENWLVAETAFEPDHQGKCEAIFCDGNGYLGQRAAFEERYVGQTRDLMVTGTFNKFDEDEVTELPNLPDVTNLEFRVDGARFAMDAANTKDYLRVMDFQTGSASAPSPGPIPTGGASPCASPASPPWTTSMCWACGRPSPPWTAARRSAWTAASTAG